MWYLGLSERGLPLRVAALVLIVLLIAAVLMGSMALLLNEVGEFGARL